MGLILGFTLAAAIMSRLALSSPGILVAAYFAMQAGWKPICAAALGLFVGNIGVLSFIPTDHEAFFVLRSEPWFLIIRGGVASYLVGLGLWFVYRARRHRSGSIPTEPVIAFASALIAQSGNIDAQLLVVVIGSALASTGSDPSANTSTVVKVLLFSFAIAEVALLLTPAIIAKTLASPIRRSPIGPYLGLIIVAAGLLFAVPSGPLRLDPSQVPTGHDAVTR